MFCLVLIFSRASLCGMLLLIMCSISGLYHDRGMADLEPKHPLQTLRAHSDQALANITKKRTIYKQEFGSTLIEEEWCIFEALGLP